MEQNKITNSIGMFDFYKGIGMFIVVLGHTIPMVNITIHNPFIRLIGGFLLAILGISLMPSFLIISGYGFRKRKVWKSIEQQTQLMLKPYLYTLLGCSLLHIITRFIMSRSLRTALIQTWSVTAGFLLAIPTAREIGGVLFYNCGPMWYIIALFEGWVILEGVMAWVKDKYIPTTVSIVVVIGWILGRFDITYFCMSQGMIAVGFIYCGYIVKRKKILFIDINWKNFLLWILAIAFSWGVSIYTGRMDNMAESIWSLGPVSIALDSFIGIYMLLFSIRLCKKCSFGKGILEYIGRNSLYIFAAHTVEMHGIPWYRLVETYGNRPCLCFVLIFILRLSMIGVLVFGIKQVMNMVKKQKR